MPVKTEGSDRSSGTLRLPDAQAGGLVQPLPALQLRQEPLKRQGGRPLRGLCQHLHPGAHGPAVPPQHTTPAPPRTHDPDRTVSQERDGHGDITAPVLHNRLPSSPKHNVLPGCLPTAEATLSAQHLIHTGPYLGRLPAGWDCGLRLWARKQARPPPPPLSSRCPSGCSAPILPPKHTQSRLGPPVQFSRSVVSDSLQPHRLSHIRLPITNS